MAFSDLSTNQMVTFTNAQSGGFTLKAGQSHVTSNQCVTKSDALTKYNLDASAMASYANNQLVPRSAWVNAVTSYGHFVSTAVATRLDACSYEDDYMYLYSSSSTIEEGIHFFTNSSLSIQFHGTGDFHESENKSFQINGAGGVVNVLYCSPPVTAYGHLISSNSFTISSDGCIDISEEIIKYSADSILIAGSVLYTDEGLTTVFNGLGKWWKVTGNLMAYVLSSGELTVISNDCN